MLDRRRLRTFILGGLTGALAGVILTPRSGRELRGNAAERLRVARERGRESYFEGRERVQERFSEAREGPRHPAELTQTTTLEPGAGDSFPEEPPETRRPDLRDVSHVSQEPAEDASAGEPPGEETSGEEISADRSEELRRKVRQTRERIRGQAGEEE